MKSHPKVSIVLPEPEMEFGGGQKFGHPALGLTLFGPVEGGNIEQPKPISHAVIGTSEGIAAFEDFAELISHPIASPVSKSEEIWPFFPGIEEAFGASLPSKSPHTELVDHRALLDAAKVPDDHQRVFQVTSLYLDALKAIARKDAAVHLAVCVVPEIIFKNCRPLSKVSDGKHSRPTTREIRMRRQTFDLFGDYDSAQYDFSLDFRKQLKARAMEFRIPVQIIRETTLRLTNDHEFGQRGLTPLSDRAWNLSTALYYKSGSKPWKLPSARPGVCYVGIAFKRTDDRGRTACSAAQMFLDDGDGIVFTGETGPWYSPATKQCHLSREAAKKLLSGVLQTYEQLHGKELTEVFLHCRSTIDNEEWQGFREACPENVSLVGIRVAPERRGLRGYRAGTRPVVRGTFWPLSARVGYLWASGFKPALRTYDGFDVPEPLRIEIQHGHADLQQVARDIFGLTKLNYNACKLGESQPVTVHFSDAVGEILVANQGTSHFLPQFKYYV
jgi:hypothetical protein